MKLERAKHHLKELQIEIINFNKGNHHRIIFNQEIEGGEIKGILSIKDFPPFDKWAVIMGDIAHNLRSSLNLLACLLVKHHTPSSNCGDVAFPISKDVKSFNDRGLNKMAGASPDAKAAIQKLMPYGGGNDLFYYISQLNNFDKHRLLIPTFTFVEKGEFKYQCHDVIPPDTQPIINIIVNKPLVYVDGAEFFRIVPRNCSIDPKTSADGESALEVVFRKPEVVSGKKVLPLFSEAVDLVDDVLKNFEPMVAE